MDLVVPIIAATFVWWFGTGLILLLDGLARSTFAVTATVATVVCAFALIGTDQIADDATPAAAYAGFVLGVVCWAWQEITLYMGYITGPRRTGLPDGEHGWRRFWLATQSIIYHEIAIALMAVVLVAISWGGDNQVALWTYVTLWVMRLSAKANIFLGVPNHTAEFLPPHIAYLASYFRHRPMNFFFPVSVTAGTLVSGWLYILAASAPAGSFEAISLCLIATLTALAVIEHWFLVLPIQVAELWAGWTVSKSVGPVGHVGHDPVHHDPVGHDPSGTAAAATATTSKSTSSHVSQTHVSQTHVSQPQVPQTKRSMSIEMRHGAEPTSASLRP